MGSFWDIVALATVEVYGDFNFKWYAHDPTWNYLGQGLLGYAGVIYFLIRSLRGSTVLYVNGMWDGMSGLIESVAAYVLLGERLTKASQYFGLLLTIVGIVLLKQ